MPCGPQGGRYLEGGFVERSDDISVGEGHSWLLVVVVQIGDELEVVVLGSRRG
jgi:hypothetical protein